MESTHLHTSIQTIENALHEAKAQKTGAAFYYKLWGAVLAVHFLFQYLTVYSPDSSWFSTLAYAVFPIGGLLSYLQTRKDDRQEKVVTHFQRIYTVAFCGFAVAYLTVFIGAASTGSTAFVTLFPLLLGFTVFVVGGVTRHTPSVAGGALAIVCTGISFFAPLEMQFLLAALASLVACLIPGVLMKNRHV